MTDIVLHHYDGSPFSEKIRLVFGHKGLTWRSVIQPNMMPKPDLVALTGGYRRIPVLQIGADVYCDSQRIASLLESLHPDRTIFPSGTEGLCGAFGFWSDRQLFPATVPVVFSVIGESVPREFMEDRKALMGGADFESLVASSAEATPQLFAHAAFLEQQLSDGRRYLLGDAPSLADFSAYHPVWFLRTIPLVAETLVEFAGLSAWADRVAGIGHGERVESSPEEALAIARDAEPRDVTAGEPCPGDPARGSRVRVAADDYGFEPVSGELVVADRRQIAVRRSDERAGDVVVHFPRAGFRLRAD